MSQESNIILKDVVKDYIAAVNKTVPEPDDKLAKALKKLGETQSANPNEFFSQINNIAMQTANALAIKMHQDIEKAEQASADQTKIDEIKQQHAANLKQLSDAREKCHADMLYRAAVTEEETRRQRSQQAFDPKPKELSAYGTEQFSDKKGAYKSENGFPIKNDKDRINVGYAREGKKHSLGEDKARREEFCKQVKAKFGDNEVSIMGPTVGENWKHQFDKGWKGSGGGRSDNPDYSGNKMRHEMKEVMKEAVASGIKVNSKELDYVLTFDERKKAEEERDKRAANPQKPSQFNPNATNSALQAGKESDALTVSPNKQQPSIVPRL